MICCLCGEDIKGYGNNAEPLKVGRCCDKCNDNVITFRLYVTVDNLKRAHPDYSDRKINELYEEMRLGFRHKCLLGERL